jgi:hypothetical protein
MVPDTASPSDRFIILRETFVQRKEDGKCEDSPAAEMGSAVPHPQQMTDDDSGLLRAWTFQTEKR